MKEGSASRALGSCVALALLVLVGCRGERPEPVPGTAEPASAAGVTASPLLSESTPKSTPRPTPKSMPEALSELVTESLPPAASETPSSAPEPRTLTRDELFDLGELGPRGDALELEDAPQDRGVPPEPAGLSRLRDRARYRLQRDEVGVEGPSRSQVGTAEGGIAIPVNPDESVQVRSGVRVDYEQDAEGSVRGAKAAPTVGVEVRF